MDGIRKVIQADVEALKLVVHACGLFPSEHLEGMLADYFNNPDTEALWLTYIENDVPIAIAYCEVEKFTEGTYNLLALGVHPEIQAKGIGKQLVEQIEIELRAMNHRILIVETSSADQFENSRAFYIKCGFTQEATLRDFWQEGEDKVVYWKKLG